jgi:hypothetical protein
MFKLNKRLISFSGKRDYWQVKQPVLATETGKFSVENKIAPWPGSKNPVPWSDSKWSC